MASKRYLGIDLAWADQAERAANESGVIAIDDMGNVLDAGWTRGIDQTVEWVDQHADGELALLFVDAPLVVTNPSGQRLCERQVGQRYGRWKVSANSTNRFSPRLAGVALLVALLGKGWSYQTGHEGPPTRGRVVSECYPYTTLVGVPALGYESDGERPRYKRKPRRMPAAEWRPRRAAACDELIRRLDKLRSDDPPLHLESHPAIRQLITEPSPLDNQAYKHREDLVDALLCAWTALLWARHGHTRCQVLGPPAESQSPVATIVAPATPAQRRDGVIHG
ncbi:DUF429 domain-containing protein [Micromonospora chersina]|uniref:DUF429 domain-containing protein n=1 Tax=Micromonospora chersina TaxID=47854 RepID=UPI00379A288E